MRHVNILNGDCALTEWRSASLPGEALVWRENYLYGELPETGVNPQDFNRIRAGQLHVYAPERSEAAILADLEEMHRVLFSLGGNDRLTLWFDVCPFDRAMLARILFLLAEITAPPQTELICDDVVWNRAAFAAHRDHGVPLGANEFARGQSEWREYRRGAPPERLLAALLPGVFTPR